MQQTENAAIRPPAGGLTCFGRRGKVAAMGIALDFTRACPVALAALALTSGCGPARVSVGDDRSPVTIPDAGGGLDSVGFDAGSIRTGLLSVVGISNCSNVIASGLAPHPGWSPTVNICGLSNAVYWQSGMDVVCDGVMTTTCNKITDPSYQSQTLAKDSYGNSLDAAAVPYVEVSQRTTTFDYTKAGLQMGSVVAVLYQTQIAFGIIGN